MGAFQWGQISCPFLYLLLGIGSFPFLYLLLSIESLEQFGKSSRSSYEPAFLPEGRPSLLFLFPFFLFVFRFFSLIFVYQAKIIQDCFYHKPLKNSTVLLSPLPRQFITVYSIFADPPLINHTNYCPLFPPALGSALFPFLPEIRALRQVANELYGHIYIFIYC